MKKTDTGKSHDLILDLPTGSVKHVRRTLLKLSTTLQVDEGAPYHQDPLISQLRIQTLWTKEKLEAWCYNTKGVDYIGVAESSS